MSDKNTSTLQSYIDSASSTVQSVVGSITGNTADQNQAAAKQDKADARDALSHSGTSVAGHSIGPGGIAKNDSNRQEGTWNQTVGSAKESFGGLVGAEGLKQEGAQQNAAGKGQEAQGQISDLGKGIGDRVSGTVGGAVASVTGDREAQRSAERQHDTGKTLQRGVESDLSKQAPQ